MKIILGSALMTLLLAITPVLTSAQSVTANAQVQAMLTQIQVLKAQVDVLKTAQTGVQTAQTNIKSTMSLIRNLKQGMSGEDVSSLQAILASDASIYPEGTISGYYGKLTAEAVRKFQKKHGFEQVGFVGPKTLKKLNEQFEKLGLSFEIGTTTGSTTTIILTQNNNANNNDKDDEKKNKKLCVNVPPGHLIAPGWLKKNGKPIIPECQKLPKGIEDKWNWNNGTTTVPDRTAPQISAVGTANLLGTTTSIVWTTNENSNSKVWFGTSNPLNLASSTAVINASLVTSHSLALTSLATSTNYYFVVVSSDANGNTATSSQNSFLTTSGL